MTDLARPRHHVRPQRGWINDPNGVCRVDGRWHVFFQYNPHSPRHHRVGWGHWSSADLVEWTEHEPALTPREGELDASGCWSGTFVMDGNTPTLIYTAVADHARDGVALSAVGSPDLLTWTPRGTASAPRAGGPTDETRDPFPFEFNGHRYVVLGFGGPQTDAAILVYQADDLTNWTPLGCLVDVNHPVAARVAPAAIWECPNLLHIDGHWVLIVSLWTWNGTQGELSGVRWMAGDLQDTPEGPRFEPRHGGVLDDGPAFYAPQAASAGERTLLWGWSWELEREEDWLDEHGWAGTLTTPRELHVRDGQLVQEPAAEHLARHTRECGRSWRAEQENTFMVEAHEAAELHCSATEGGLEAITLPAGSLLLVDGSLVELFHEGRSHTTRIYPTVESEWSLAGGAVSVRAFA